MAKKNRAKTRTAETTAPGEVGPRQPCPCGSGKRYKACHGSSHGPVVGMIGASLRAAEASLYSWIQ